MYFSIPYQSYLISGEKMGLEDDVCYLGISGFVPDKIRAAVLGQPFLQNFLIVLDQGNMEIGLGAHIGSTAEIHPGPVGGHAVKSVLLTLVLLIIAAAIAYLTV
jgi:hypothetical protein